MSSIHSQWSVASVFNSYGMYRFSSFRCSRCRMNVVPSERVADCIRSLGYAVTMGICSETSRYVILSIQCLKTNKYVYGTAFATGAGVSWNSSWRALAGNRTINEKVRHFYPERFECEYSDFIRDVSTIISKRKIFELIDNGKAKNQFIDEFERYVEGVSTIGNTLPCDIVNALRDFTSDDPDFIKEPWYEFYIPMTEEMACPIAEASANCSDDGHSGCGPATISGIKKDDNDSSSSSSDCDSEDENDM